MINLSEDLNHTFFYMTHYDNLNIETKCLDDTPLAENTSVINSFEVPVISHRNNSECIGERKNSLPPLLGRPGVKTVDRSYVGFH